MNADGHQKNCLLIQPRSFHVVAKSFRAALEELGYVVTEANEEYPENPLGKALAKADLPIARWLTARAIRQQFLTGKRYDLAVIVKGRGITAELACEIGRHAERVVGYQFDALDYDPSIARWTGAVHRMSTFDYRDAARQGWPVAELFCGATPPAEQPLRYRLSAIMRNHSQRVVFLDRVMRALGPGEDFVYIFEKSRLSYWLNFLRAPGPHWRWRKHVHFTPLAYDRYAAALGGSRFTLDYAHPRQRGATMRSFEALALGVRLITNNAAPSEHSRYFGPDNVIVIAGDDDLASLPRRMAAMPLDRPPSHWRTAVDCMRDIIGVERSEMAL